MHRAWPAHVHFCLLPIRDADDDVAKRILHAVRPELCGPSARALPVLGASLSDIHAASILYGFGDGNTSAAAECPTDEDRDSRGTRSARSRASRSPGDSKPRRVLLDGDALHMPVCA